MNDRNGHDVGDQVLVEVAKRLTGAVRPSDHVARYGGDEFMILCYDAVVGAEEQLSARIAARLAEPIEFAGGGWMPAASVGMTRPRPGDEVLDVVKRSDQQMYADKQTRRAVRPSVRPDPPAARTAEIVDSPTG